MANPCFTQKFGGFLTTVTLPHQKQSYIAVGELQISDCSHSTPRPYNLLILNSMIFGTFCDMEVRKRIIFIQFLFFSREVKFQIYKIESNRYQSKFRFVDLLYFVLTKWKRTQMRVFFFIFDIAQCEQFNRKWQHPFVSDVTFSFAFSLGVNES